jgi:hypothetical protein
MCLFLCGNDGILRIYDYYSMIPLLTFKTFYGMINNITYNSLHNILAIPG